MSKSAVELVVALLQEVNGHLHSCRSKQLLRHSGTPWQLTHCLLHLKLDTWAAFTLRCMSFSHSTERMSWMSASISSVTPSSSSRSSSSRVKIPDKRQPRGVHFTTQYRTRCQTQHTRRWKTVCLRSQFNSCYLAVDLWRPDRRGPGWSVLLQWTWQISGLWHSAAFEPFWCLRCPQVPCGHRCLDQRRHLWERKIVLKVY